MLGLRSSPSLEKLHEVRVALGVGVVAGHSSLQGWRLHMEDAFIIRDLNSNDDSDNNGDNNGHLEGHSLLAVFDGHAGSLVSTFAASHLIPHLLETEEWQRYSQQLTAKKASNSTADIIEVENAVEREEGTIHLLRLALVKTFVSLDETLRALPEVKEGADMSGAAAVVALLTPTHILCANLGDSRCVLRSGGRTVHMSEDHKPEDLEERVRIEAAGGFVAGNRVNGELAMSRALGDFRYKDSPLLDYTLQKVITVPDIAVHRRCDDDELLLLACDGVFDVMSNSEAVDFVHRILSPGSPSASSSGIISPEQAASELIDLALSLESTDNISAIVLPLKLTPKMPATETTVVSNSYSLNGSYKGGIITSDRKRKLS